MWALYDLICQQLPTGAMKVEHFMQSHKRIDRNYHDRNWSDAEYRSAMDWWYWERVYSPIVLVTILSIFPCVGGLLYQDFVRKDARASVSKTLKEHRRQTVHSCMESAGFPPEEP